MHEPGLVPNQKHAPQIGPTAFDTFPHEVPSTFPVCGPFGRDMGGLTLFQETSGFTSIDFCILFGESPGPCRGFVDAVALKRKK